MTQKLRVHTFLWQPEQTGHKLECEKPGWTENDRTELRGVVKLPDRERLRRMLLRVNPRGRVQKVENEKPQRPGAYSTALGKFEELLTSRGA